MSSAANNLKIKINEIDLLIKNGELEKAREIYVAQKIKKFVILKICNFVKCRII